MRLKIILAVLSIAAYSCPTPAVKAGLLISNHYSGDASPPADVDTLAFDIILGIGQSNMAGVGTLAAQDSGSGAWLWDNTGSTWEVADGPLNRYAYWGLPYGLGPMNSFGKEAASNATTNSIGLVVNGVAGTTIQEWRNHFLPYAAQRALNAKANNPGNEITAVFYHQGENNAATPELWLPYFRDLRHYIDSVIGYDTPVIVGGLFQKPAYQAINDTIKEVVNIHDCYYVSSDSLTSADNVHFDAVSYRILGLRYYDKYLQVTP